MPNRVETRELPELKVIFFDAVGTLIYLPRGVGHHYEKVAIRQGWKFSEAEINSSFRAAWRAMPARLHSRGPRPDDDRNWWRELVGKVLDACGAPNDPHARKAYFSEVYAEFARPGVWELFPEVREVLAPLSERFTLGMISNFDGRLRQLLGQFGVANLFQYVVISSEVGADKPHPAIFEEALRQAGVRADEALHVGDDPELDWRGAAAVGLHIFALERPKNSLRDLLSCSAASG